MIYLETYFWISKHMVIYIHLFATGCIVGQKRCLPDNSLRTCWDFLYDPICNQFLQMSHTCLKKTVSHCSLNVGCCVLDVSILLIFKIMSFKYSMFFLIFYHFVIYWEKDIKISHWYLSLCICSFLFYIFRSYVISCKELKIISIMN